MSGATGLVSSVAADASPQLQGLQELPLPAPVSYVPQTIGWLFVAVLLLALALLAASLLRRPYERQRYRRNALQELAGSEASLAVAQSDPLQRAAMLAAI